MRRTLSGRLVALFAAGAALFTTTTALADTGPVTLATDGYQLGRMSRIAQSGTGTLWVTYQQKITDSSTGKDMYLPALVGYDTATGTVISGPTQVANDTYTDIEDHNFSSIFNIGSAGYLIAYDAADTYKEKGPPPLAWPCLSSGGGAGSSYSCQPFKISTSPSTMGLSTPERNFPGTGISELTGGTINGITLMAGQVQDGSIDHAGAAAYYAVHDLNSHPIFETSGKTATCTALTYCYDPLTDAVSKATNGQFELAAQPSSNQWYAFQISNVPQVSGAHFEVLAAGSGGNVCTYSDYTLTSADHPDDIAKRFVSWWNADCAYRSGHLAVQITNTKSPYTGTGWVGMEDNVDVDPASTVPASPVSCVTITCTSLGVTYNHFLLGTKIKVINGTFYAILPYDTNSQNWFYGGGTTSDAGGWAVLKAVPGTSNPSSNNSWTWTDIGGANPSTAYPDWDPTNSKHRILDPPASDPTHLSGNPYIVHNPSTIWNGFPGFINTYQDDAWPKAATDPYPVFADSVDLAIDRFGNLWWSFACQDSNQNSRLCYLIQSGTTKASLGGGFADGGGSAALARGTSQGRPSPNIYVDSSGRVHITTLVGTATTQPWNCGANSCVIDAVTTPTGAGQTSASWTITNVKAITTAHPNQAAVGDSVIDASGTHIYSVLAGSGSTGDYAGTMPQYMYDHGV